MGDAVQVVTTALAVLGTVLGVMNAWRNWMHDSVNVNVSVDQGVTSHAKGLLVTVRNLSRFALTVNNACIQLPHRRRILLLSTYCVIEPFDFPVRLESRTAMTIFIPFAALPRDEIHGLRKVQIKMACGAVAYSSGISRDLRKVAFAHKQLHSSNDSI